MLQLVRPIPRVKNVDKYESWEIEANDGAQYELAVPRGRSDTYAFGPDSPQQLQAQHPFHRGGYSRTDTETFDEDEAGWGSLKNVRLPWKKGPKDLNKVQEVHATTEFDIDDYNGSSATVGLATDAESIYSQRRPPVNETEHSSLAQVPVKPPQPVSKDSLSYSDPFSEPQGSRR